ncbi:MAG TPA: sigma-70 family RNA polymerase sigma factor [Gemmataceae bacterium]|nr:sigma-70 family RNA polymerase sigma factor [Gemmataceae bacterium]
MSKPALQAILRQPRRVMAVPVTAEPSDRVLLEQLLHGGDEEAFAQLLWRHEPMVRRTCQRLLVRQADVDDAVQAVFLVLVRAAGTLHKRNSVAGWLYGIACRLARNTPLLISWEAETLPASSESVRHQSIVSGT